MSLKKMMVSSRRINFKLSVFYAFAFILGAIIFFSATYLSLSSELKERDHAVYRQRLLGYWARFQAGGPTRLIDELNLENLLVGERPFFVRLAHESGTTLFLKVPEQWEDFDFSSLEDIDYSEVVPVMLLPSRDGAEELEIVGIWLSEDYLLQVGMSNAERMHFLSVFRRIFLIVFGPAVLISVCLGILLSSRLLSPLHRLNAAVQRIIETGNIDSRITSPGTGDELDSLIEHFNAMLMRIQRLVTTLSGTLDAVAHDMRTPMTHFRVRAEEALNSETSVELYREALTSCVEESEQILRMLSTLMDISEAESGLIKDKLIETDLSSVVEEACLMYQFIADERNIVISHSTERNLIVSADPVRIGQVVNNLIDNAVKYSRAGSAVAVASRREDAYAVIIVADEGPGIPEDELSLIWNRLYRGRAGKGARGSGLGLSLAKAIVDAYGGTIRAENRASGGAVFTVRVPLSFAKEQ